MTDGIKKGFFAAANTSEGFKSFFEDTFFGSEITKRYILKGGPGTGKSSFMRRVARRAELEGRAVEYYFCSSDTDSLDGIIIDKEIAVLDGTAPHSCDTVLPGICDGIIDLGQFWREELLEPRKEAVLELVRKKKDAYGCAYRYLSSAGQLSRVLRGKADRCLLTSKMSAAARRLVGTLGAPSGRGELRIRQTGAYGCRGYAKLDTQECRCKRKILVDDHYGTAYSFLSEVVRAARGRGIDVEVSLCLTDTDMPEEVFFSASGELVRIRRHGEEHDGATVNMKRFADPQAISSVRSEYREASRVRERLCELALSSLARAGDAHAEMEKYYVAAMDFERQSRFCEEFADKLSHSKT